MRILRRTETNPALHQVSSCCPRCPHHPACLFSVVCLTPLDSIKLSPVPPGCWSCVRESAGLSLPGGVRALVPRLCPHPRWSGFALLQNLGRGPLQKHSWFGSSSALQDAGSGFIGRGPHDRSPVRSGACRNAPGLESWQCCRALEAGDPSPAGRSYLERAGRSGGLGAGGHPRWAPSASPGLVPIAPLKGTWW